MTQYLLLRSNKQSGPYSAEDLRQMGLKPYDLIWVDGKSAAWRYPGEIDELKAFAPAVEEQPYDRFYRKPAEQKQEETPAPAPVQSQTPAYIPAANAQPVNTPPSKKEKEYKRVFVTLPNGSIAVPKTPAPEPKKTIETPQPKAVQQPLGSIDENTALPAPNAIYYPKRTSRIKAMPIAGIIIAMIVMTGIGIVIGLSLNNNSTIAKKTQPDTNKQKTDQNIIPASNTNQGLIGESNDQVQPNEIANIPADTQETVTKAPVTTPQKKLVIKPDTNFQKTEPVSNATANTEDKKDEEDVPAKKAVPKPVAPNLDKYVAVSNNDYQVGPFGGISKLELTVKNTSEYDLNLVVVQLEYLKVNKEVFKTENLYFRDVAANSSLTLNAPKSNRGNKINYKVTLINSKDHLFHAGN